MRSKKRTPELAWMRIAVLGTVVWIALLMATGAAAQGTSNTTPQQHSEGLDDRPSMGPRVDEPLGETQQKLMREQLEKRNKNRQEQLVADTNKLLTLATELKAAVDKSNKDTLSVTVVQKSEEIEKLAKSVKDKMKNAD